MARDLHTGSSSELKERLEVERRGEPFETRGRPVAACHSRSYRHHVASAMRDPFHRSASELKEELVMERRGVAFMVYRDGTGHRELRELDRDRSGVTVGRGQASGIALPWDDQASRVHAELQLLDEAWILIDEGLSRNGSYVNGERVVGRRRLNDGDTVLIGETLLIYRNPTEAGESTAVPSKAAELRRLSDTQRRVLIALARPYKDPTGFSTPATNKEIANELFLSVEAIKAHLRVLFTKFGVDDLPPNEKRTALAGNALTTGAISFREL